MQAIATAGARKPATDLKVKLFADGAEKKSMLDLYANPLIRGFTTNPTLMRKANISDYQAFARDILSVIRDRPISFEVFADDFEEMERQARLIATWGQNVYVKIPVTKGIPSGIGVPADQPPFTYGGQGQRDGDADGRAGERGGLRAEKGPSRPTSAYSPDGLRIPASTPCR